MAIATGMVTAILACRLVFATLNGLGMIVAFLLAQVILLAAVLLMVFATEPLNYVNAILIGLVQLANCLVSMVLLWIPIKVVSAMVARRA